MGIKHLKFTNDEELIAKTSNSYKNTPANAENMDQMKNWLDTFAEISKINVSIEFENKIKEVEGNLGVNIPPVLRLMYLSFGNNFNVFCGKDETKIINYRLLNIDELNIEKNVVICEPYKGEQLYETDVLVYGVNSKGKKLYGVDLYKDWDLAYSKKWFWVKNNMPLYKNLVVLLVCLAISKNDHIFKTNIKNIGSYKVIENADKLFSGNFERFEKFEHYEHTLYYNSSNGALGWLRAGNSCPEILIGCNDETFTEKIIKEYGFDKIKKYK